MSSIQTLDHWTNVTLDSIWKEQVNQCIQNNILTDSKNATPRSNTPPPTRIAFNQQALCLAPKRRRYFSPERPSTTVDDSWYIVQYTPFTEPFWGVVVNK
jgi:hypothetical protein